MNQEPDLIKQSYCLVELLAILGGWVEELAPEELLEAHAFWDLLGGVAFVVEELSNLEGDIEGVVPDVLHVWEKGGLLKILWGGELSEGPSGNLEDLSWAVLSLGSDKGEADTWEDPGVVSLGWDEGLAVVVVVWEWRARAEEGLLVGPLVSLGGGALGLASWVRKSEDDWALGVLAHGLDDWLGDETWAARNADDGGSLELLSGLEDGGVWLHVVHVWLVEWEEVVTAGVDHTLSIEHDDVLVELLLWNARVGVGKVDDEVGDTGTSGTSTDEDDLLLGKLWNALDPWSGGEGGSSDGGGTLDIVVEAVALWPEVVEEAESGFHLEVLPLDKAGLAEDFLDSLDEFLDELKVLVATDPWMPPAVVEWVVEDFLPVGTDIELDWEGVLWLDLTAEGVEHELTDWDTKAGSAEVTKTKDSATIGDDDAADVLVWIVPEDVLDVAGVLWGDVDAPVGLAVGSPLLASLTDGWGVENWHAQLWWVAVEEPPEGGLILFTLVGEEDVLEEWGWHELELAADTGNLLFKGEDLVWDKAADVEAVTLFTGEASATVELWIAEELHSGLAEWEAALADGESAGCLGNR